MHKFLKDFWNKTAKDMKILLVLFFFAIVAVIYFCGIKGNNKDNFWNKDKVSVEQLIDVVE